MADNLAFVVLFFAILIVLALAVGRFMGKVFIGEKTFLDPFAGPLERLIYKACRIDPAVEMDWKQYALSLLLFNAAGFLLLFIILLLQSVLPFNPQKFGPFWWDTALNTAISFMTNTNWQSYAGESSVSYFTQMAGLTVQNFMSAATGLASALALFRGFIRHNTKGIGNFWVDIIRATLYVLLPLSLIFAVVLVSQGVVQTLGSYIHITNLQGGHQTLAVGPVAMQEAIKELGNNGGGFFNANSAHPFENPNYLTNFLQMMALLLFPFSLPFTMGYFLKSRGKGVALFMAMFVLLCAVLAGGLYFESRGNPNLARLGIAGGANMEGKETRFGIFSSAFYGIVTTVTSTGAVNSTPDSFLPLTGLVQIFNMGIGEIIFGGIGVGIISMLFYAFMTMYLAGLMIGRTPEIYNKKLEPYEMAMTLAGMLSAPIGVLLFSSAAAVLPAALSGLGNSGPHGLSELLYNYASSFGNNGSAFAGMNANTPFYNLTISVAMLIGRFATILPALAIAGSLARKKFIADTPATFQTSSPLFVAMLVFIVIVFGGLTFFMPMVLGPVLDHLFMHSGRLF